MKEATEIFERHWIKATGKPLDEATKQHMLYAIEAVDEALRRPDFIGTAIAELNKIPVTEWAKIWCELNRWEFPACLSHIKPIWWGNALTAPQRQNVLSISRPLMAKIEAEIGEKACSREWNRDRMTDEQHEAFWKMLITHVKSEV